MAPPGSAGGRGRRVLGLLLLAGGLPAAEPRPDTWRTFPAVAPAAAAGTFRVKDGFTMDLLAAEPLVASPVALAYDEDGRAYVAEMRDYPYTDKQTHQPWRENTTDAALGRVRLLVDDDGDGRFDRSFVFADGLSWPTGVCCWQGGVFVTATPDLWYLKDTDGDHRADVRLRVLTGFRKFNIQTAINNPRWGLDNRITIATSSNGGQVVNLLQPGAAPARIAGRDLRLDPRTHEAVSIVGGTARFGQAFDDWGNRFLCSANNPAFHVVFDGTGAERNPYLTAPNPVHDVREAAGTLPVHRLSPLEPWRVIQAGRWQAAQATTPRKELAPGGIVTSAAGITIYRGSAYPAEYAGQAFVGEVANNVVHRQRVAADGVTFAFTAADAEGEFVASTDTWFRPVNFVNAPDGTLHVVDLYRETVEHPWSLPDDLHAKLDLTSGRERGRIYRLTPPGFAGRAAPRLGAAKTAALVAALEHPDAWWRETAQRLLVERQDRAAEAPLRELAAHSGTELGRLHALWALEGLGALRNEDLRRALNDAAPGVREHAVRLAAPRLADAPELRAAVLARARDDAVRVRYQVAFAAGGGGGEAAVAAALAVLERDAGDRWVRAAALGAAPEQCAQLAERILRDPSRRFDGSWREVTRQLLAVAGAQRRPETLAALFDALAAHPADDATVATFWSALADGLRRTGWNLRQAFRDAEGAAARAAAWLAQAGETGRAAGAGRPARLEAVRRLAYDDFSHAGPVLEALLAPGEEPVLQRAAAQVLLGHNQAGIGERLLAGWSGYAPALREEIIGGLLARKDRTGDLLGAIESGRVAVGQVSPARRAQLLANSDPALKARAARLFGPAVADPRATVLARYRPAVTMAGDVGRGRRVFEQTCAACHRLGGQGGDLGPPLETIRGWDREKTLLHILDPNREVAPNYVVYGVELRDGTTVSGLITEETPGAIKVRRIGAPEESILRQQISRITGSALSLMPEGLEAVLSLQDMADLLALLTAP